MIPFPFGTSAINVAVTPDGGRAYVTDQNSAAVLVIATATNTVIDTIPVGVSPFGVAVTRTAARSMS